MLQHFRTKVFAGLIFALFGGSLWAQHPYISETKQDAIKHVKNLQVASLDPSLPKVTLEFFLKYEGEGASIEWSKSNCGQLKLRPFTGHDRDPAICVEARVNLKDSCSAIVVVSLGKPGTRS